MLYQNNKNAGGVSLGDMGANGHSCACKNQISARLKAGAQRGNLLAAKTIFGPPDSVRDGDGDFGFARHYTGPWPTDSHFTLWRAS